MHHQQRAPRHGHVAQRGGDLADNPAVRGIEHMKARLRFSRTGLRLQRFDLCLCRQPLRLGPVQRGLADELHLQQLLLALQFSGGDIQSRLRGLDLRCAASHILLCSPCVNAHQRLTRLHAVARPHQHGHDGSGHLRRQGGLAHSLDHGLQAGVASIGSTVDGHGGFGFGWGVGSLRCALQAQGGQRGCRNQVDALHVWPSLLFVA